MKDDEFKKLFREMKILRAKKDAGGFFHPKDAKRLAWLEERLGEAPEVKRIRVDDTEDDGPKTLTSDDHYATEISEEVLIQAEDYDPQKVWEKDVPSGPRRSFEAKDTRKKGRTFKQEGLSQFAIEAHEDLKEGEIGLADAPKEEEESAQKMDFHRAVYASDESERLTKKPKGKKSNPFALEISDGLVRGLDKYAHFGDSVPDTAAKSWEVKTSDDDVTSVGDGGAVAADELSDELDGLLRKSYSLPKEKDTSLGSRTTHEAGTSETDALDYDLMRQAMEYAEERGLVEDEGAKWATDEEGREIEYVEEGGDVREQMNLSRPPARATKRYPALEDPAPTKEMEIPAGVDSDPDKMDTAVADHLGVLIPSPPEQSAGASRPAVADRAGPEVLIPEPPTEPPGNVLIPAPPETSRDVLIPEPPRKKKTSARFADGTTTQPGLETSSSAPLGEESQADTSVLIPPPPEVEDVPQIQQEEILELPEEESQVTRRDRPGDALEISPDDILDAADLEGSSESPTVFEKKTVSGASVPEFELDLEASDPGTATEEEHPGIRLEVELEEEAGESASGSDIPDSAGGGSGSDVDIDQFWGLSGDSGDGADIPEAPRPRAVQEEPSSPTAVQPPPPRPAAAAPKKSSRPLPALGASAFKAAPEAEKPTQPSRTRPEVRAADRPQPIDHDFMDNLFTDGSESREEGLVPTNVTVESSPAPAPHGVTTVPTGSPMGSVSGRIAKRRAGTQNEMRGPRKATVHFKDGVNRRGVIGHVDTDADLIRLDPQPGSSAPPEDLVALSLKAIFLMLPRGTSYPEKDGYGVKAVLVDGRTLEGFTPDYDPQRKAFTLFPKEDRGNIERIIVFNDAVRNIWFDQ